MNGQATCDYTHTYSCMRTGIVREYQCTRPRHKGDRNCIFHTDRSTDPDEARRIFIDELESGFRLGGSDPLFFIGCRIPSIDIVGLGSTRSVYFTDAKFLGDVEFTDMDCKAADFTDAEFNGHFRMVAVTADILRLRKSRFGRLPSTHPTIDDSDMVNVDLDSCNFKSCDLAFVSAQSIVFSDCDFTNNIEFRKLSVDHLRIVACTFGGTSNLAFCRLGRSLFKAVTFNGTVTFENTAFEDIARFEKVHFQRQELVRFPHILSNASFINTNMTRVRFDADSVWNDDKSHVILDERRFVDDLSVSSLSDTLAVYRSLRECHEYWLMYEEAGQFYIREMDLRRCYRDAPVNGSARRRVLRYISLTSGYNALCRYGESFRRASAWVAGVFGAATLYYCLYPDHTALGSQDGSLSRLADALERTLAAFLHSGRGGIDDYIVRVASLPTLGSMFIVLKRRLERRFRH